MALYKWATESLVHTICSKPWFIQKLNTHVLPGEAQQFCCGFLRNIFVGTIEQKHNIVFKIIAQL